MSEYTKYYPEARDFADGALIEVQDEIINRLYYLIHLGGGKCVYWGSGGRKMDGEFPKITINHDSQDSQ